MSFKQLGKHFIILLIIATLSNILIYLLRNIIPFHPNAHFDLTRSIVIVYSLYILIIFITPVTKSILPKKIRTFNPLQNNRIRAKWDSPIIWIGLCFSLLTVINSLMMIFGLDTPKQGVFAYVHMIMRLSIITLSVSLCTLKEWRDLITKKTLFGHFKKELAESINVQYVSIVFLYCMSNIILSPIYYIPSGVFLYETLVGIYIILVIIAAIKSKMALNKGLVGILVLAIIGVILASIFISSKALKIIDFNSDIDAYINTMIQVIR